MKKILFLTVVLAFASCKKETVEKPIQTTEENYSEGESVKAATPEALGAAIFEGKGNCVACHQVDKKVIGPSLQDIAKIYKDKNGNIVNFLKGESDAIVDPEQFPVMQANLAITKTFSDEELKGIEAYINSNLK
jgi:cytochrome c